MKTQQPDKGTSKSSDVIANWDKQVKAAHKNWDRISETELNKLDGSQRQLTSLVEDRYKLSHSEAEMQVKSFAQRR